MAGIDRYGWLLKCIRTCAYMSVHVSTLEDLPSILSMQITQFCTLLISTSDRIYTFKLFVAKKGIHFLLCIRKQFSIEFIKRVNCREHP